MADTEPWQAFWLASELSAATSPGFAARINNFEPAARPSPFAYPAAPTPLPAVDDRLGRLIKARRSQRDFADQPLPAKALASIFSAFAHRAWPSAGALYPLEVFAFLLNVEHALNGRVVHYEPDSHALTDIGAAPPWSGLAEMLSADGLTGTPHAVVVFVLDTAAAEDKYGNRAGRFALIEVGHAAQSLALRLAADELAGCELGGGHDRPLAAELRLGSTGARVALAYACGVSRSGISRGRRRSRRSGTS